MSPVTTAPAVTDVGSVLDAVAAHGLAGSMLPLPGSPLDSRAWSRLLASARRGALAGHLLAATAGGALPATDEQVAEARGLHLAMMGHVLLVERHALAVCAVLTGLGVPHRLFKGASLAHVAYPDPALRPYGDLDLLVASDGFGEAVAALVAEGHERLSPALRPGFDERFGKAVTLRAPEGLEVDLHRTFVMGPFGLRVRLEDLYAREQRISVGGRTLPVLAPEEQLLAACYNAALGDIPPRRAALRDVAELVLHGPAEPGAVLERARRWGGQAVLARAVRLTWERFALSDATPLSHWAGRFEPSRADERALRGYIAGRRYAVLARGSLRVLPVADRLRFLRALLLPDRAFLAHHGVGRVEWLRRGRRSLGGPA